MSLHLNPKCGSCGSSLYSDGTCPSCDWPRVRRLALLAYLAFCGFCGMVTEFVGLTCKGCGR